MVTSCFLNAISKEIADSLLYLKSAHAIWADLHKRFHQSNAPRIFQIKQQLHVFNLVVQEECQRSIGSRSSAPSDSMAFNASSPAPSVATTSSHNKPRRERPIFTHCGLTGHTVDRCYKLHGFPPGYKPKGKAQTQMAQTSPLQSQSTSPSSFTEPLKGIHYFPFVAAATVGSSRPPVSLSLNQQTIDLLESPSTSGPSISQIYGNNCSTQATHHVCCNISLFSHSKLVYNTTITLLNDHVGAINRVGFVRLSDTLNLDNVLFVPMFTFNLLSISALTLSHNCSVNFLSNSCVIQDLTQGLTIGKVHIDIWGPFNVSTPAGHRYFLTIVDDYTRATWVYLLCAKVDVLIVFPEFFNLISTQYNTTIKSVRSDNALELAFHDFFRTKGIIPYHSCVATPEQNSIVEPVYLINRTPSPLLSNKTPFELLNNNKPTCNHLRIFGCLCYASTLSNQCTKFAPRARASGYKLLDLESNKIYISWNVIFHESLFLFAHSTVSNDVVDLFNDRVLPKPIQSISEPSYSQPNMSSSHSPECISSPAPIQTTLHLHRVTTKPAYLSDYHCCLTEHVSSKPSLYHISSCLSYHKLSKPYREFVLAISSQTEPTSFSQAIESQVWHDAMNIELYKARLVAKGFTQQEAAIHGWSLTQLDVTNTFLHGDLMEEVYMSLPPGYTCCKGEHLPPNAEVDRSTVGISICQRKYALELLSDTRHLGCKPATIPMDPNLKLSQDDGDLIEDPTSYRRLIAPRKPHFQAIFHILQTSLISWKSKKQPIVSRSFAEAKYRSMANTTCEILWLLSLLHNLKIAHHGPAILVTTKSLSILQKPVYHVHTKLIEIDCHIIREKIQAGILKTLHVTSQNQLVNILTKALHPSQFHGLLGKMGIHDLYSPS
ncbi:hypothetical protein AAG906_035604 [Vitis piasezkii]